MKKESSMFLGETNQIEKVTDLQSMLRQRFHQDYNLIYPGLGKPPTHIVNNSLSLISQSLIVASAKLKVQIPPVEFFIDDRNSPDDYTLPEIKGNAHNNSLRLRIELGYFIECAYLIEESDSDDIKSDLWRTLGEEMHHVFIAYTDPLMHLTTQAVNEIGGDMYRKDPGEIELLRHLGRNMLNLWLY